MKIIEFLKDIVGNEMLSNKFLIVLLGTFTSLKTVPPTKSRGRHGVTGVEFINIPLIKHKKDLGRALVMELKRLRLPVRSCLRQKDHRPNTFIHPVLVVQRFVFDRNISIIPYWGVMWGEVVII